MTNTTSGKYESRLVTLLNTSFMAAYVGRTVSFLLCLAVLYRAVNDFQHFGFGIEVFEDTGLAAFSAGLLLTCFCRRRVWHKYQRLVQDSQNDLAKVTRDATILGSYLTAFGEVVDEALLSFDEENRVVYSNAAAEIMFGYSGEQMKGLPLEALMPQRFRQTHQYYVKNYRNTDSHLSSKKHMGDWRRVFGLKRDGTEFPVQASVIRARSSDHGIVMVALRDMSMPYQLEAELQSAASAVLSSDEAKTQFLGNISHELRTPLNAIIGFSEILMGGIGGPLNERQRGYVQDIMNASRILHNLVNDILSYSKMVADQTDFVEQSEDVAFIVKQCISIASASAARRNIRIQMFAAPDLPDLLCDARALKQIVTNLLSNAVKFSPENSEIEVEIKVTKDFLELSVRDHGIGISEEDLPKIFEPFRQLEDFKSRRHDGTGIGLAIVKTLVRAHAGSISVDSTPGSGTTFRVIFPKERCVWLI